MHGEHTNIYEENIRRASEQLVSIGKYSVALTESMAVESNDAEHNNLIAEMQ